ncbi:SURF1 family protein [Gryllotalpicola protaetiae]|uniref:SURF1-like protein n=2 Tax=Gryllotalpicola protaetiae TaxID=2419771 RepID=A0A387C4G7_9MICO|nr:SURF1 family protein [Gryllotalpicola protaetiae]
MVGWEFTRTRRWILYIVAAVVFAAICGFLSHWQYDRGQQATRYNTRVAANFDATPVTLDSVLPTLDSYDAHDIWKPVTVTGEYLASDQLFVRTRPCGDDTGFEVLTPLRLDSGRIFIVDRGCIDAGSDPQRPKAEPKPPAGTVSLVARIEPGESTKGSTPAIKNQIESIDLAQIKQRLGDGAVYTGAYGLLDTQTPASATALTTVISGAPTVGTVIHWSYMVQWVLIAMIGFAGLWYGMRTEFRRINADHPEERERARKRRQRAAKKKFTDAEVEDELLDGFIPLSRWGIEGKVAIAPPGPRPRASIDASAPESNERPARRSGPDVIVIQPSEQAPQAPDSTD